MTLTFHTPDDTAPRAGRKPPTRTAKPSSASQPIGSIDPPASDASATAEFSAEPTLATDVAPPIPTTPAAMAPKAPRPGSHLATLVTLMQAGAPAANDDAVRRVSAAPLEAMIGERVGRLCPGLTAFPKGIVARVDATPSSVVVSLTTEMLPGFDVDPAGAAAEVIGRAGRDERLWLEADGAVLKLAIAVRAKLTGGRTEFVTASGQVGHCQTRRDAVLIKTLKQAQTQAAALLDCKVQAGPIQSKRERDQLRLAFLAPDIQRAILDGRQPVGMTLKTLTEIDLPLLWSEQRAVLDGLA